MEQLSDDMLANVLGRLPPSSLAASRCVRKDWCSIIDARRLLRTHLLPLRLEAIYCINLSIIERVTYFFARPPAARRIPGGTLEFLEYYTCLEVQDHCNGLLFVADMVVNPATRQWATLPEPPIDDDILGRIAVAMDQDKNANFLASRFYLVYDPMADSPQHFEVFLIPFILGPDLRNISMKLAGQEWPPSTLRTHVFSSTRWRWEVRSWIRQGEPAWTVADMLLQSGLELKAVYFRRALYVHCQDDSVMRISLSNDNKYQMVRSPATQSKFGAEKAKFYLEKSEKGVYFVLLYWVHYGISPQFQVWLLKEEAVNDGNHTIHFEWVLKTNVSLEPLLEKPPPLNSCADNEWMVIRYSNELKLQAPPAAAVAHDNNDEFFADDEWDFDNAGEVVLEANKDNKAAPVDTFPVDFLGFHPYKEIVFFSLSKGRTIFYNLNTSRVQWLGDNMDIPVGIRTCFPYTPCWLTMGELFENN